LIVLLSIVISVNDVELGVSLRSSRSGVDVMTTEVASKVEGLLDWQIGQILVSEGNDFTLGHEQSELILSGWGELA
jgi:hypothetical protein